MMQGPAAEAGLMVGDVITMLNGQQISSVDDFEEVAAALSVGRAIPVRIVRRGSPLFLPIKIPE